MNKIHYTREFVSMNFLMLNADLRYRHYSFTSDLRTAVYKLGIL